MDEAANLLLLHVTPLHLSKSETPRMGEKMETQPVVALIGEQDVF